MNYDELPFARYCTSMYNSVSLHLLPSVAVLITRRIDDVRFVAHWEHLMTTCSHLSMLCRYGMSASISVQLNVNGRIDDAPPALIHYLQDIHDSFPNYLTTKSTISKNFLGDECSPTWKIRIGFMNTYCVVLCTSILDGEEFLSQYCDGRKFAVRLLHVVVTCTVPVFPVLTLVGWFRQFAM